MKKLSVVPSRLCFHCGARFFERVYAADGSLVSRRAYWKDAKWCGRACYLASQARPRSKPCNICGKIIEQRKIVGAGGPKAWATRLYCSKSCAMRARGHSTGPASLLSEQSARKTKTTCLIWTGSKNIHGYGFRHFKCGNENANLLVHRVAYAIAYGDVSPFRFVCHRCDERACIEPTHLYLGNQANNMRDMAQQERGHLGDTKTRQRGISYSVEMGLLLY